MRTKELQKYPGRATMFRFSKTFEICIDCAAKIACEELGRLAEMWKGNGLCDRCHAVLLHGERRFVVNILWSKLSIQELVSLGLHI